MIRLLDDGIVVWRVVHEDDEDDEDDSFIYHIVFYIVISFSYAHESCTCSTAAKLSYQPSRLII